MNEEVLSREQKVGKKRRGRGIQVRLDAELVRKAKFVASARGKDLQDYLFDKLERVVDTEFRKLIGPAKSEPDPEPEQGDEE